MPRHPRRPHPHEVGTLGEGNEVPTGSTPVRVEAALPDGRFGWLSAAYDPATGQFHTVQVDLSNIPPELRYVQPTPGGQRIPLSDYLTLRAMRLLNVSLGPLRTVRIHGVENVRSVLQIWRGDPPLRTQVVSGQADAVVRGGGRVVGAQVVPGTGERITLARLLAVWEGDTPPPDMVARHNAVLTEFGLDRTTAASTEVTSGFDVDIQLQQPAGAPPVPVVPGGARDRDAGD